MDITPKEVGGSRKYFNRAKLDNNSVFSLQYFNFSSYVEAGHLLGTTWGKVIASFVAILVVSFLYTLWRRIIPPRIANMHLIRKKVRLNRRDISLKDVPVLNRIAYRIRRYISFYPTGKLLALLPATVFATGFGSLFLYAMGGIRLDDALWLSWTIVADSLNLNPSATKASRIATLFIHFEGMMLYTFMVGLISRVVSEKVDSLRQGQNEVIESNHIIILGWSTKLSSLLKQLSISNARFDSGGVVVILADRDKVQMEADIENFEIDFQSTMVICQSGSPHILADLKKVSLSKAHAVIVLACDGNVEQSDAKNLRVVFSLAAMKGEINGHIVVEMNNPNNKRLVKFLGGEPFETITTRSVFGRLMIKSSLHYGLAKIWEEILGSGNVEFYMKECADLCGNRFKEVLDSSNDGIPCGVKKGANSAGICFNPPDDCIIEAGDKLLLIGKNYNCEPLGHEIPKVKSSLREHDAKQIILICGWGQQIDDKIKALDTLLARGSQVWLFNKIERKDREKKLNSVGFKESQLLNIKLKHEVGNPTKRQHLDKLPLETFDYTLILAEDSLDDSRALETLLLIRDIKLERRNQMASGSTQANHVDDDHIIMTEILDSSTRDLITSSTDLSCVPYEYFLPNELITKAITMVVEAREMNSVLDELFADEGYEICIKPALWYLQKRASKTFNEIMIRARERREILIGYQAENKIIINPPDKSRSRQWRTEFPDCAFVVISKKANSN